MIKSSAKVRTQRAGRTTATPVRSNVAAARGLAAVPISKFTRLSQLLESVSLQRCVLIVLTCACLLPFLHEAFHVDDTLFLWAAKQIVQHPLDPYGFSVDWYGTPMPMSEVTKNPPLAAYFLAFVGSWAGWSEWALHLAFLLPAVAVILGVHQLARGITRSPLLASVVSLAAPVFLISATSVMCDVPMLALWLMAIVLWRKGILQGKLALLAGAGAVIGICSLTKYFGVCLIPLLLLYSIWNKRRIGAWLWCLLIPVAMLAAYQFWTASIYTSGLLSSLDSYVSYARDYSSVSPVGNLLVALSFTGGCVLPALLLVPWLWSRKWIGLAGVLALSGMAAIVFGWVRVENAFPDEHRVLLAFQLGLFILGGVSALSLAVSDFWRRRDSDSVLLLAWVLGTFIFAGFLNWTVNGRSILPMVPAVGLLMARRLEIVSTPWRRYGVIAALVVCLVIGLWATAGDAALANSARTAALQVHDRGVQERKRILFSGHWGFQYYMESMGGVPLDPQAPPSLLDLLVIPRNNSNPAQIRSAAPSGTLFIPIPAYGSTMRPEVGAGFYSSSWGPMPYAFAPVPDEGYDFYQPNGIVTQTP